MLTLALFPDRTGIVGRWNVFLFTGPVAFCAAIGILIWAWREWRARRISPPANPNQNHPGVLLIIGAGAMFIGCAHLFLVWSSIKNETRLQFDGSDVVQIDVQPIRYNSRGWKFVDPAESALTVTDHDLIL